jgi:hypothetical protein
MSAWTVIAHAEVPSGGQLGIEFTSIPQTYTDLLVLLSLRNEGAEEHILISFNGSSSNFSGRFLAGIGTSVSSSTYARYLGNQMPSGAPSNTFGNAIVYIPNYTGSTNKSFSSDASGWTGDSSRFTNVITAGLWSVTDAITSVKFEPEAASDWAQYSSATLYGILKGSSGGVSVS